MNNFADSANPETTCPSPFSHAHEGASRKPVTDPVCVRRFIQLFNDHAAVACVGIDNPGFLQLSCLQLSGTFIYQRFRIGDVELMTDVAVAWSEGGLGNVYIEGRTIRSDAPLGKGRGKKEHTGVVFALTVDDDPDKLMGASLDLEPTIRTETSPGNSHETYFLKKAVSAAEGDELGYMLKTAVGTSDFDTGNITQPYRVAGTVHYVNDNKRARGRVDCETKILSVGKVYEAEEFRSLLEASGGYPKRERTQTQIDLGSTDKTADEVLSRSWWKTELEKRLAYETSDPDYDRSTAFYGLVGQLQREGYTPTEALKLIKAYPNSCWNVRHAKKTANSLEIDFIRSWDKISKQTTYESKSFQENDCDPRRRKRNAESVSDGSEEGTSDALPIIQINGGGLSDEADQAEVALIEAGVIIYQRGGELVRPYCVEMTSYHNKSTKITHLSKVTEPALNDLLCRSAVFVRRDARSGNVKRVNPPPALAKTILARQGSWKFRTISGVASSPILRPDGSVMMHEGYDPITCLYVDGLPPLPEMPAHPSREDAMISLERLLFLISEFPFVDEASRSVGLSGIITAVCRSAMQTSPMHIATAPTPGTGKSFLHDIAALIATGSRCPVTAFSKSADENEKRLDGSLLDGAPIISIDNANGELGGDKLCQAVERPLVEVRRLGSSDKQKIENRSTIFANGNNITLRGDITRRSIIARLDSALERPEARQFKCRPDQMIQADRGRYIVDCLIIVCAYIQAGSPNLLPGLSSFEDWSKTVRSALVWLGCADPLNTMKLVQEGDPEHIERCHVFNALYDVFGPRTVSVKEITSAAQEMSSGGSEDTFGGDSSRAALRHPELVEALMEIAGKNERIDNDLLGKWLRANKARIADGRQLLAHPSSKRTKWAVKTCATGESN